jgi:dolichyl-phosphate beta-glucosyltransferase
MQMISESSPFLSVIIPAYNEHDRILPTLEHALTFLQDQTYQSEIIVVSDGSSDNTAQVVQSFTSSGQVRIAALEYHPNRGKGYAVRYGMLRAEGQIVMFMDADYAVPIEYCKRGLAMIERGFDVAIASRAVSGAQIKAQQNLLRKLSARIYTFIQNIYLRINFADTQCGFKFFTRQAAQNLFRQQKLDSVIFDPEILWLAQREGYRVGQFPVQWRHVADSRIQYDNLRKSIFVFRELFRIKQLH